MNASGEWDINSAQLSLCLVMPTRQSDIYMLFADLGSVRIVKNCDRGLENAARGRRPRTAFSCYKLAYKWVYATLSLNGPGLRAVYEPS